MKLWPHYRVTSSTYSHQYQEVATQKRHWPEKRRKIWLSTLLFLFVIVVIYLATPVSKILELNRGSRPVDQNTGPPTTKTPLSPTTEHIGLSFQKKTLLHKEYSGLYRLPLNATSTIRVTGKETLSSKVSRYSDVISDTRKAILTKVTPWKTPSPRLKNWNLVAGTKEDYLRRLSEIEGITGIFLDWTNHSDITDKVRWSSLLDHSNLAIQKYYPWTGSDEFCRLLRDPSERSTHHRWGTVYNKQCDTDWKETLVPKSMELFVLNAIQINAKYYFPNNGDRFPERMYTDMPRFLTYLHVIKNGVLTVNGEVYKGEHKIVPYGCHPNFQRRPSKKSLDKLPIHTDIFSLSQYWGKEFFHKILEDYPKVAPFLEFLKANPKVKVQVSELGKYTKYIMGLLGIDHSRLIAGDFRGRIIYLPRATSCGFTNVPEVQLLSQAVRRTLGSMKSPGIERRNLILVRRSVERHFTQREEIAQKLNDLAREFNLKFYLFNDNPLPSLNETMYAFNRAIMVVAPHGAGLSNLLYSEPGTYVIEGLCNPPHTNMCYTRLSYVLGHHYHALVSRGGCEGHVDIPASEIVQTARSYLQQLKVLSVI